jgi:hypothetical protein
MTTINVMVPGTKGVTMAVEAAHMGATRSDLLSSARLYDRWRDGTDALLLGTPIEHRNYTGAVRNLTAVDDPLAMDRAVFHVRTHADDYDTTLVESIDTMREARANGRYDWDCHKCQTAVYTETLDDACPNCLL